MSDLIDRQAAIDAVCIEWCGVKYQECEHPFDIENDESYWCDGCETALQTLPNLPSAQPEIIRCGDCLMHGVCRFEIGLGENGFCSQGKRGNDKEDA